jgi:hypothetical protein
MFIGFAISYGVIQASHRGDIGALRYQINRNYDESKERFKSVDTAVAERFKSVDAAVSNIYSSLSAIHSIKTDVEVIKTQIKSIEETLRRMERSSRPHHQMR